MGLLKAILLLFTTASLASAQQIIINISGSNTNKFFFYSVSGEKTALIDSSSSVNPGQFSYDLTGNSIKTGMYRLVFDGNKRLDFIFDQKDVNLSTGINDMIGNMQVNESESNRLFFDFIKLNKAYKSKSELLQLIVSRYPKDDKFYTQAAERLAELQKEYRQFVTITSQADPKSFAARYIRSAQQAIMDISIPQQGQLNYLKSHGLDNIDFNDTQLTESDVFSNKSIEYLMYYSNPQLPKELLEKEFCKAVDSLLERARVNQFVYQHTTEYLISGFRQFGFEVVLDYIVENYVIKDDICLDEQTGGMIKRRIDQARILKTGNTAPDINLPDPQGKQISVNNSKPVKKLIVFYSTQCPHCKDMLPELNKFVSSRKGMDFEVFAVSLDTKKSDWTDFIKNNCNNFTNLSDLNGWDGKASNDYYIYATPSMFLLDQNFKILAKPVTLKEVQDLFP